MCLSVLSLSPFQSIERHTILAHEESVNFEENLIQFYTQEYENKWNIKANFTKMFYKVITQ